MEPATLVLLVAHEGRNLNLEVGFSPPKGHKVRSRRSEWDVVLYFALSYSGVRPCNYAAEKSFRRARKMNDWMGK